LAAARPFLANGSMRALVVSTDRRVDRLPDVPTMTDAGFPHEVPPSWFGLFGPAGLSPDVVHKINADVTALLKDPEMKDAMQVQSLEPFEMSQSEFESLWRSSISRWRTIVKETGAAID